MTLRLVMLAGLIVLCSACAAKKLTVFPAPVVGIDIAEVSENQQVPFNGTLFSARYLNEYTQYECEKEGKC